MKKKNGGKNRPVGSVEVPVEDPILRMNQNAACKDVAFKWMKALDKETYDSFKDQFIALAGQAPANYIEERLHLVHHKQILRNLGPGESSLGVSTSNSSEQGNGRNKISRSCGPSESLLKLLQTQRETCDALHGKITGSLTKVNFDTTKMIEGMATNAGKYMGIHSIETTKDMATFFLKRLDTKKLCSCVIFKSSLVPPPENTDEDSWPFFYDILSCSCGKIRLYGHLCACAGYVACHYKQHLQFWHSLKRTVASDIVTPRVPLSHNMPCIYHPAYRKSTLSLQSMARAQVPTASSGDLFWLLPAPLKLSSRKSRRKGRDNATQNPSSSEGP